VLLLLAAAVLVVVVFRTLKLPPLLGYLVVGVAIGPHALGVIPIRPIRMPSPSSAWCS
jgi:CPA2 family monovalent cation:H+ antiporter-2